VRQPPRTVQGASQQWEAKILQLVQCEKKGTAHNASVVTKLRPSRSPKRFTNWPH